MYNVDSGARYAKLTINTSEVVKFPVKYNVFGVKGENITVKLNPTDSGDGVYSTADSDGNVVIAHYANLDTVYLYGTGEVIVWASNSPIDIPFADGSGSGGGSAPDTYLKTAAIGNDGSLTLTKQDNTTVSLTLDATPAENSTHAVTSGGVYTALQNVGGFTRTLLYDCGAYNTGAPYQTVTSLLDNLSKYDFIVIMSGANADYTATSVYISDQYIFDARFIMASSQKTIRINSINNRQTIVEFTDTTFKITYHQATDSNYMQVYNIYGYKFG